MNFSYSLPCEYPVPVWDARWRRKVALLMLAGLTAFLWMSSRNLLFCGRKYSMLWFTRATRLWARKAGAFQQLSAGTWAPRHSPGWEPPWIAKENVTAGTGNLLQLQSGFCVPQTLQWPDWLKQWRRISSSSNHISHGRMLRQVGQGGVTHVAGSGLRWVTGSLCHPAGLSLLAFFPVPDPHLKEGQMSSWPLRADKASQTMESRLR